MNTATRILKWLWLGLLVPLLLPLTAQADDMTLQEWLDAVTPRLTQMAGQHPRFKGQSVGIVGLEGGKVIAPDNALTAELKTHFETALLQVGHMRVPLRDHASADVLLGIETQALASGNARILVAYLDPVEGIWINRSRHQWEGRLPLRERRLLAGANTPTAAPERALEAMPLVSLIGTAPKRKYCERNECVDVSYEVFAPAYVFEFYTRGERVTSMSCELTRKKPGVVAYGLNVPDGEPVAGRPDLGFYVLATTDRDAAQQLRRLLSEGKRCGKSSVTRTPVWRDELARLVSNGSVSWRASHFERERSGVRVL